MGMSVISRLIGKFVRIVGVVLLFMGNAPFVLAASADDALVEKFMQIFQEHTSTQIDGAMARAKSWFIAEIEKTKNRERVRAFDGQVKTLIDKGYPEAVRIDNGYSQAGMGKDQFLRYVNRLRDKFEIGDIIVIPEWFVSIPEQMSLVKLYGNAGITNLDLGALRQAEGVEKMYLPYLIRDVEIGNACHSYQTSPDNCVKRFNSQGRLGLVTEEGIAVITHNPDVLKDSNIILPGSRYLASSVPILWLDGGGPRLGWVWASGSNVGAGGGSASCGSRIY